MSYTATMQGDLSRSSKTILHSLGDVNPIPPKMEVSAVQKDALQADSRSTRPPSPQVALPPPKDPEADIKLLRLARHSLNDMPSRHYHHADAVGPLTPDRSLRTQSTSGPFPSASFTSEVVCVDQILSQPSRNNLSRGLNVDVVPISEPPSVQPGAQNRTISGRRFSRTNFITTTVSDEASENQQAPPSAPPSIPPLPGVANPFAPLPPPPPPPLTPAPPFDQTAPLRSRRPSFARRSSSLSLLTTQSTGTLPRITTAPTPPPPPPPQPQPPLLTPQLTPQATLYPVPPLSPRAPHTSLINRRSQPSPAPLATTPSLAPPGGAIPAAGISASPTQTPIAGPRSRSRLSAVCENGTPTSPKPGLATRSQRNINVPNAAKGGEVADGMTTTLALGAGAGAGAGANMDVSDDESRTEHRTASGQSSSRSMLRSSDAGSTATGGGGGRSSTPDQLVMSQREKSLRRTTFPRSPSFGREPPAIYTAPHSEGSVGGSSNRHHTSSSRALQNVAPTSSLSLGPGPAPGASAEAWGKWEGAPSGGGGGRSSASVFGRHPQAPSSTGMEDPDRPDILASINYMLNSTDFEGPEGGAERMRTEWIGRSPSSTGTGTTVRHLSGSGVEGEVDADAGALGMRPISALRRRYRVSASGESQWGCTVRPKGGTSNGMVTGSRTRYTRSLSGAAALAARRSATASLAGIDYMHGDNDEEEEEEEEEEEGDAEVLVQRGQMARHSEELPPEVDGADSGSHSSSLELSGGMTLVPGLSSILDPILDELDPRRQQVRRNEQRLKQSALGPVSEAVPGRPRVVETWADGSGVGGGSGDPATAAAASSTRGTHPRTHVGAGGMLAALAERVLKLPCVGLDKLGDPEKRQKVIQRLREKGGSVFQVQVLSRTPQFRDRWCN